MTHMSGMSLTEGWILWALILYVLTGIFWLPVVWIQIKMRDIVNKAYVSSKPVPTEYWVLNRWWIALGALAFPTVSVIFYLMVFKPNL